MEVVCELQGVLQAEDGAVDVVDAPDGFLGVPGGAYFAVGVAGVEEATEACPTAVADAFMGCGEEASYPIERAILCGPCARGFRSGLCVGLRRAAG